MTEPAADAPGAGAGAAEPDTTDPKTWWRLIGLISVFVAATVVVRWAGWPVLDALRSLGDTGPVGPVLFALAYAACTLGPVPRSVLSTTAGVVFGFGWGVGVAYTGSLLGAAAAFVLARRLGSEALSKLIGDRAAAADDLLRKRGLVAVLALRVTPVMPFTAVNYGAGLTTIRWAPYWLGTVIGVVPGTLSYVAVGAYATSPGPWGGAAAVALVLTAVIWSLVRHQRARRRSAHAAAGSGSKELADQGVCQPRLVAEVAPAPLDDEQVIELGQRERESEVEC